MKSFTRHLLLLSSLVSLSAFVASCGQNLPPSSLPSGSPSPVDSSASPVPTAPPSETPQESPSPDLSPSPEPTVTPFPSGTPQPANTPLPTPSPVFGADVAGSATFVFRARVITEGREVLPVIQGNFTAHAYNLAQIKQDLALKNKVEARPLAPSQADTKYQLEQKVCTSSGCTTEQTVDVEAYRVDFDRYNQSVLPDWEARAYAGLEAAISQASEGHSSLSFSTDSNGEAALRLPYGTWYFNGRYSANGSAVVWDSIPFVITENTRSVELTR
ncbi:MAG: hypothetical protein CVV27_14375 [Candidatus Melainabacteria bacterium HGW-Melainabacteria-1]|nr:MAG: hypothetical protein CVV27_14375 [Candidatus Melainabacteria bacterium HGW-Melainabacteria-1]